MLGTWAWVLLLASAPSGLGPRPSSQFSTPRWLLVSSVTDLGSNCLVRMLGEFIHTPLCLAPLTPTVSAFPGSVPCSCQFSCTLGSCGLRSWSHIYSTVAGNSFSLLRARSAFHNGLGTDCLCLGKASAQQCHGIVLISQALCWGLNWGLTVPSQWIFLTTLERKQGFITLCP